MSDDDQEQLRTNVWDRIYVAGPQSIEQLAEFLQLDADTVQNLVQHPWFSMNETMVEIATGDE